MNRKALRYQVFSCMLAGSMLLSSCTAKTSSETDSAVKELQTSTHLTEPLDSNSANGTDMDSSSHTDDFVDDITDVTDENSNGVTTAPDENLHISEETEPTVSLRLVTAPPETTTVLSMENHVDNTFSNWFKQDDATRIAFAKQWYTKACEAYATFVGTLFAEVDTSYIQWAPNGTPFYLMVTEPYAHDLDLIFQDYWYTTFSKQYDVFYELVLPQYQKLADGTVYAMPPQLGRNEAYVETQFLDAGTMLESEVKFQIRDCYSNAEGQIDGVFSLVYEGNGNWKVGQFVMPY